ncbi:SagB/ThcOx family dehydrogenase [Streptomyces sp. 184]|uniref:SagB/ThcOx family dehydrogenase n=1 Tax=Streptomyces sp. 184 TaxID=1827526 RepID=UPI003891B57B
MHTVFAPVDFIDTGPRGARYRRTSPSAGACQELEAYLAAPHVHGLAPGWYHYNAVEHSLELLAQGCTGAEVSALRAGQQHAGKAAFLLVLTAVIGRLNDHRATARSYRVGLLNAGHLGQTFVLTATALGLGSMQLSACNDGALAESFGLDAVTHVPVHVLGAGLPDEGAQPIASPAGLDAFRRTTLT